MTFVIDESSLANFRSKYAHLHPLVFQRSLERASSSMELFEILEGVPRETPFSWDEARRSWVPNKDIMAFESLKSMRKRKR
jgi:hypothetical protein